MDHDFMKEETEHETKSGRKLSLNFADKDEKENAKFNDARLVDILRNYPLLYNKSLESFGDPDYTQWMWGEIANEMNEPHRKTTLNLPFNWTTCRDQWEIIRKSLRYLSNPAEKSFRFPKQFKECVDFFQNYIRDNSEPTHTDRSQDLFLNFSGMLETLPFEKQLLMEKEILDVILSNELEFCAPIIDPNAVEEQARDDFGTVISLLMPEVDVRIVHNELSTEPESELDIIEEIMQKPEATANDEKPAVFITQPLTQLKPGSVTLNRLVEDFDFKNLVPSNGQTVIINAPVLQNNVHYAIQEDAAVDDIIEEDGMDEENIQVESEGSPQEEEMQECVFEEVEGENCMQEEHLIEEVVPEGGGGKDMPALNISDSYDIPGARLDFDGVLNEMLG